MNNKSKSDSINSSEKRKHSVEENEESLKKSNNNLDQNLVITEDQMDRNEGLFIGRGRGRTLGQNRAQSKDKIGTKGEPTVQKSSSSFTQSSDPLMTTNEDKKWSLKAAEERSGMTLDIISEWFKIDGNVDKAIAESGLSFNPISAQIKPKDEVKTEDIETKDEKKFKGKQYVEEAKQKDFHRNKELQKAELLKKNKMTFASTSSLNREQNRNPNASTLSLITKTTDIESVGTFLPQLPESLLEDQSMTAIINQYFGESKPKRAPLPIKDYETRILQSIRANRVVIIEGATGCGKTTQVPQFIADDCASMGLPFNIVVTQPRRIAAKSIAARVAEERSWSLGTIVGYQIGMDRSHVNEDTRILYCTTGVLLQKLINTQRMDNYSHIIIDEVHERGIETDLLLLVVKKLMSATATSVKLILMSATFDASKLVEYFSIPIYSLVDEEIISNVVMPSHIAIVERPQQMHIYYLDSIKRDLKMLPIQQNKHNSEPFDRDNPCVTTDAMDTAARILEEGLEKVEMDSNIRGSVLVFLPGLEEIHEMKSRLERVPSYQTKQWKIYPLHSSIPLDKQNDIFHKPRGRERKIILATNIAESSITVPDVEYVIDFCLTKNLVCDMETHIPVLRMEWAAQSNCEQRAGRCGRVKEGRVYRLIQQNFYETLHKFGYPELVRSPLELSILRVKMLNMGPPKELLALALDPPDLADIYKSVLQLKQCGAFAVKVTDKNRQFYEEEDGDITTLGVIMSHLPIDIRLGKLVVMGHVFNILEDCIIIAACLSTQGFFRREFGQGLSAYKSRLAWADRSFSDSIAFLNAYKMYKSFDSVFGTNKQLADKWCKQNFLQYKRILEVDYMIAEITDRLRRENIFVPNLPNIRRKRNEEELILKVAMCAAFYPNYFLRHEIEVEEIPKKLSTNDPFNTVVIQGLPQNQGVIYAPQIREMFKICSKQIDLSFEDTKCYLTFLEDRHPLKEAFDLHNCVDDRMTPISGRDTPMSTNSINPIIKSYKETAIKTAVYVAIAMRSSRNINKSITKYSAETAKRKLDAIKNQKRGIRQWKSLHTSRISVPMLLTRVKLTKLMLPALDCSEFEIRITAIEDPALFYAQYNHKCTEDSLNKLSELINYECDTIPCDDSTLRYGDIVIAPYKDFNDSIMFGRGRVENIEYKGFTKEIEKVLIFFIDFGFSKFFDKISEISQISAKSDQRLTTIAPQAFRCQLSEVIPSPVTSFDGCWNKKAIDYFTKFVKKNNYKLTAKIYSVVERVVRLELFETENRNQSFNDLLISIGFAEKAEENIQSKLNHEHRRNAQLMRDNTRGLLRLEDTSDRKGVYNSEDVIEVEIDDEIEMIGVSNARSHESFIIKGPFSPLEATFKGITNQTSNRRVNIEKDSVNCVVLEPDYLSKHSRLLVASSIGLGPQSENINLRDTTLMPNIRGFPAIMALLFAPNAEFQVDKDNNQYIGAICGLGFDPKTKKSFDPGSDAQIAFDADISREDVTKINIIRYNISEMLKNRENMREFTDNTLAYKQRKIRRLVIELLDRRRRLKDTNAYPSNFRWGLNADTNTDEEEFKCNEELKEQFSASFLPILNPLRMNDYDWFEDIKHNLEQLKEVHKGAMSTTLKCKLCNFTAYTLQDITFHITSNEHIDKVNDFNKYFKINEDEKRKQEYYSQRTDEDEDVIDVFDSDDD